MLPIIIPNERELYGDRHRKSNMLRQALDIHNEYIPLIGAANSEVIKGNNKRFMQYVVPLVDFLQNANNYNDFTATFAGTDNRVGWRSIRKAGLGVNFWACKGMLVEGNLHDIKYYQGKSEEVKVLMCVAIKRQYLYEAGQNKNNPNPNHFVILVARSCMDNVEHFKLFRNMKRLFLDEVESKIDILYTNRLEELCFNVDKGENPNYTTLQEMLAATSSKTNNTFVTLTKMEYADQLERDKIEKERMERRQEELLTRRSRREIDLDRDGEPRRSPEPTEGVGRHFTFGEASPITDYMRTENAIRQAMGERAGITVENNTFITDIGPDLQF